MRELQSGWSSKDKTSPFYTLRSIQDDEWVRMVCNYPYSVRVLVQLGPNITLWSEHGRTSTIEQAHELLQALVSTIEGKEDRLLAWVVMEYVVAGEDDVRERPVLWHPHQEHVLSTLRQVGLLKD